MQIVRTEAENVIEKNIFGEPPETAGRHYTAADLVLAEFPDPGGYLGGNMFNPGTLSMIAGMPKCGKSMLTLALSERIATGKHFGPWATKQGRVLYISEEMHEPIQKRRLERMFGLDHLIDIQQEFQFVFKPGLDLNTELGRYELHRMVKKYKAKVVFMDCFTDIHKAEEKDNQAMAYWMGMVRDRTAVELGCCVVFIHHFRKRFGTEKDDIRGAGAISAALGELIFLIKDEESASSGIMRVALIRDGMERLPTRYMFTDGDDGSLIVTVTEAA